MKGPVARKEKMIVLAIISTIAIFAAYAFYIYYIYISVNPSLISDFRFLSKAVLMLIPVTIVAQLIVHIIFAIINKIVTNEEISSFNDERDKLIELKAIRISHWTFILGFFTAMGSQAIGMQSWVMFFILILSGFLAAIASELTKLYFYRKGF